MFLTNRLSIQSKLTLMLLGVCIGSIVGISYLGYTDGRAALEKSVYNQLGGIRVSKANLVNSALENLRDEVITFAEGESTLHATIAFTDAYRQLASRRLTDPEKEKLHAFYKNDFLPKLAPNVDGIPVLETYFPVAAASQYLQYQYIAANPLPYERKSGMQEAADGTEYSKVHKRYHPRFSDLAQRFSYEDVMLVDAQTLEIVYTYQKTVEFATSLANGPYADTNLGQAVRKVRKAMDRGDYLFADFEHYRPNLGRPSAFIASPIFDGPRMVGILVVQFPIEELNRVVTGQYNWAKEGLGRTGEVFLVGHDRLVRSRERLFFEDREGFLKQIAAQGVSSRTIQRIKQQDMTVMNLEINTMAVDQALAGKQGIGLNEDFRGVPVLASFAPIEVEGERWAIIAKIDQAEAFAPIRAHGRKVLAYSVGAILLVTLLASLLAHVFTRPIRELTEGARAVASGRGDVVVQVHTQDEFRDLAVSFNAMTWSLQAKTELIEQQVRENEELLLNILPGPVAARMKEVSNNGQLTESFADVTVLFADIDGFTELAETMRPDEAISLLHDLVVAVDDAAERFGVEKVKTVGTSYMAVCGLSIQRPDHTNRMVDFARELLRILHRFNLERGVQLGVNIGINAGPVVGGVVGRTKFIYDLWGDTVNVAHGMKPLGRTNVICVTQIVRDRLRDLHEFASLGTVEVRGKGPIATWTVTG